MEFNKQEIAYKKNLGIKLTFVEALQSVIDGFMEKERLNWYKLVNKSAEYPAKKHFGVGYKTPYNIIKYGKTPATKSLVAMLNTIKEKHPKLVKGFTITNHSVSYEEN